MAQLTAGVHRIFRFLLALQWLVAVVLAWANSLPGESRLAVTFILGGMLCVPPALFTQAAPHAWWSRHFVAVCQMGWSTLFMWLLDGRPEAQFHMFASLAFLASYRDQYVLLAAVIAAISYPVTRLLLLPESYAVGASAWWRIFDSHIWVVLEAAMLVAVSRQSLRSVHNFGEIIARLQMANEDFRADMETRTAELARSREQFRLIGETTRAAPFELDLESGRFTCVGPQVEKLFGIPESRWKQPGFLDEILPREREATARRQLEDCAPGALEILCRTSTPDGDPLELRWTMACEIVDGKRRLRGLMVDVTEARRLERELAQGQKLESVGRIAAGVAHEINTSVQFISDSVSFVRHALKDVPTALADYRTLVACTLSGRDATPAARKAAETDEAADVDYFLKNAPEALDRALEGIGRVGSIVKSMTEFAHPDSVATSDVDVNRAIKTTLNMARNEYKNVAELETEFAALPPVRCLAGDLNQVILNLLLNAAHAIGEAASSDDSKGRILVRTRVIADFVEVSITDNGNGIPESVRNRIFEPFVTTKKVGHGTGQGLAIARGIVVEKLNGSLHFETQTGVGTTFFVRLPAAGAAAAADSSNQQAAA